MNHRIADLSGPRGVPHPMLVFDLVSCGCEHRPRSPSKSRRISSRAQKASGAGLTQTVRSGLQLVAASGSYARLRQLRGKVHFNRTAAQLKADRWSPSTPALRSPTSRAIPAPTPISSTAPAGSAGLNGDGCTEGTSERPKAARRCRRDSAADPAHRARPRIFGSVPVSSAPEFWRNVEKRASEMP